MSYYCDLMIFTNLSEQNIITLFQKGLIRGKGPKSIPLILNHFWRFVCVCVCVCVCVYYMLCVRVLNP